MTLPLLLALLWLPLDHPLSRGPVDGCTVQVLGVTVLSSEADSWVITWDADPSIGLEERAETHFRSRRLEGGWSRYGEPVRFPVDRDVVLRWRIEFPEPSPSAVAIPFLALCPLTPAGAYRCVLARTDTQIVGQSLYSRRSWALGLDHPRLGVGRPCPELEEVDPLVFFDGFESGDTSAWSRAIEACGVAGGIFCDGFESGDTSDDWERSVP